MSETKQKGAARLEVLSLLLILCVGVMMKKKKPSTEGEEIAVKSLNSRQPSSAFKNKSISVIFNKRYL